jgi:hypothetical protein
MGKPPGEGNAGNLMSCYEAFDYSEWYFRGRHGEFVQNKVNDVLGRSLTTRLAISSLGMMQLVLSLKKTIREYLDVVGS